LTNLAVIIYYLWDASIDKMGERAGRELDWKLCWIHHILRINITDTQSFQKSVVNWNLQLVDRLELKSGPRTELLILYLTH